MKSAKLPSSNVSKEERRALKDLRKDENILTILPADKVMA